MIKQRLCARKKVVDPPEIVATYDYDETRSGYHRFTIDRGQTIKGAIYFPRDALIPDAVIIRVMTPGEKERDSRNRRGPHPLKRKEDKKTKPFSKKLRSFQKGRRRYQ